jgi:predicted nucleic acid-binding protein
LALSYFRIGTFWQKGLSTRDIQQINALVGSCFIAELNPDIKKITKDLLQSYPVKLPDAIIAATSIYLDLPLLTSDTAFQKLPDLKLVLFEP